jgi:hypothetical protein
LTFKKDLDISHGMEMAAINARDIQKGNGVPQAVAVHQVRRETDKPARWWNVFSVEGHTTQITANSKMLFAMRVTKRVI